MTAPLDRAREIAVAVRRTGGRALVVGGWVRDRLMGHDSTLRLGSGSTPSSVEGSKNIDLEVFGVAPDRLRESLESFDRVEAVGESFQVYKIGDIDVSLPRRDSKSGRGHRGFVVVGDPDMSIAEAARRRDFTINAIAWDPLTEEYFDPFDGRGDLERRLLRVVDPKTFPDDSLRVLRAIQFAARFELALDETTRAVCRDIGKPPTTALIDGRIRSMDHEEQGVAPTLAFLDRLNVHSIDGYDVRRQVVGLVAQHLKPGSWFKVRDEVGDGAFRRLAQKVDLELLARVAKSDCEGRKPGQFDCSAMDWFLERARSLGVEHRPPAPILLGRHVLELGLEPGPRVGEILKAVYEQQLDGRITTLEEAIDAAKLLVEVPRD